MFHYFRLKLVLLVPGISWRREPCFNQYCWSLSINALIKDGPAVCCASHTINSDLATMHNPRTIEQGSKKSTRAARFYGCAASHSIQLSVFDCLQSLDVTTEELNLSGTSSLKKRGKGGVSTSHHLSIFKSWSECLSTRNMRIEIALFSSYLFWPDKFPYYKCI